jgi:hypothetical protein
MTHEIAGREQGVAGLFKQVSVTPRYEYDSRRVTVCEFNLAYKTVRVTPGGIR